MRKPVFLCDVDDVVVDYVEGFTAAVITSGVRNITMSHTYDEWDLSKSLKLTKEEDQKVYALINMPGFAARLNPCAGAVDGIKRIQRIADVCWVTSPLRSSPTWAFDRREWLEHYFGEEQKIISTSEKHRVDGDFLLDDKPDHCKKWQHAHPLGNALLWSTGRNTRAVPDGVLLVNTWPMVLELVRTRAKLLEAALAAV